MPRPLKVYGWQGDRRECPPQRNGGHQTREICAARSQAAVARIAGERGPWALFNLTETGNAIEIAQAMSRPGVIFWRSIDDTAITVKPPTWTAVEPTETT